jgi:hypothetical protein
MHAYVCFSLSLSLSLSHWLVGRTERYVALKVVKSAPHYREAALDEVKLCQRVATADASHPGHAHVAEMLDSFEHLGPHGQRTHSP